MDRFSQFAMYAAAEAMADSGLDLEREDTARIGVCVSSGVGGMQSFQNSCEVGESRGFDKVSPFFIPMIIANLAAGRIAIRYGLHGMCTCPVTACAGGSKRWATPSTTSGTAMPTPWCPAAPRPPSPPWPSAASPP